jgi:hypothetical protein
MWFSKDDKDTQQEGIGEKNKKNDMKGGATEMEIQEWNMELRQNNITMDEHNVEVKRENIECSENQRRHDRENELILQTNQANDRER